MELLKKKKSWRNTTFERLPDRRGREVFNISPEAATNTWKLHRETFPAHRWIRHPVIRAGQQWNGLSCQVIKLQLLELLEERLNGHQSEIQTDFSTSIQWRLHGMTNVFSKSESVIIQAVGNISRQLEVPAVKSDSLVKMQSLPLIRHVHLISINLSLLIWKMRKII